MWILRKQKSDVMSEKMKNFTLPLLSFVCPGLSHAYLGYKKKAISLAIVFGVILLTFFITQKISIKILMILAYVALAIPSAVETGIEIHAGKRDVLGQSRLYVAVLLLITGMAALPLLWQGRAYRLEGKILWTVIVVVLAALFFFFLGHYMNSMETFMEKMWSRQ